MSLFRFSRLTSASDSACYVTCTPKRPTFVVARYVPSVVSHPPRCVWYPPRTHQDLSPKMRPSLPLNCRSALPLPRGRSHRPFVLRGDMEIKSIPLFRGLHREIGSYFICAIKTRTMTRGRKSGERGSGRKRRRTTTTVPSSQAPQAEGCTRPDLLIVDMPIVCSSVSPPPPPPPSSLPAAFRDIF